VGIETTREEQRGIHKGDFTQHYPPKHLRRFESRAESRAESIEQRMRRVVRNDRA
jgi:hypothetical protein